MNLLFDLDGTLTDPFLGITKCIAYALDALGRPVPSPESLRWCIGPPLRDSLKKLLASEDDRLAEDALAKYRERFAPIGIFENQVYPDIFKALETLKGDGHILFIATSKPTVYADRIAFHFGLNEFFNGIYGSELDGKYTDKSSLISHVLQREAIAPSGTIMIGDRKEDMIGARNNKIPGIGVLWGYGTQEELLNSGAHALARCPSDLRVLMESINNEIASPA